MATFVFLHDVFQGGWIWKNTAQVLRQRNCEVHTPTLTGCAERSHIAVTDNPYDTYHADIENYFRHENITDAILVCNGTAGMLAPSLVRDLGTVIQRVIFLDAILPYPGQSLLDVAPAAVADAVHQNRQGDMVAPSASSLLSLLCDHTDHQRLCPAPLRVFTQQHPNFWPEAWPPCQFLHCAASPDMPDAGQSAGLSLTRAMLNKARVQDMEVLLLPLSSYPYWLRHEELARTLLAMALPQENAPERGPCGRVPMPESLRMAYCAHHRKRVALAAVLAQAESATA